MGLTKTKRLEAKLERKMGMTIIHEAGQAWRDWVDTLEVSNTVTYESLWLKAPAIDPKAISNDYHEWRNLVQKAFFDGYYRGMQKKITGE